MFRTSQLLRRFGVSRSPHRADGQVIVVFALAIFVLVGFVGLSIDAGFLMAERRQAQNAADAGALAAAASVLRNRPLAEVQAAGKDYGSVNAGVGLDNVVVNWPPLTGMYAGNPKYVEAIVTKPVEEFFIGALYSGDWSVTARAVAGVEPSPRPYALLALNSPGIYINGSTTVYVEGGSAMSNSNISSSGGSNIFFAGGSIDASGYIQGNSNWSAAEGINSGVAPIDDPLKHTPPPPPGDSVDPPADCKTACTFYPGRYTNKNLNIQGTATFTPGIYYFDGTTKLSLQNSGSWIKGNGVLFYFTGQSSFDPKNGNIQLTAPASSPYSGGLDGMLLWITNCSVFDSQGGGVFSVEGVIYAPCSHVLLHGNSAGNGVQVIVGDLVLQGTSDFRILYREYVMMDKPKVWLVE